MPVLTHGHTTAPKRTKVYRIWQGMNSRCHIPSSTSYKWYGSRGIKVCDRWRNSFEAFLEDMGHPEEGQSLERKEKDGNYEPSNCCWAGLQDQNSNKRNNLKLTWRGETLTISEWSRKMDINMRTLLMRLKLAWTIEDSLTIPLNATRGRKISV